MITWRNIIATVAALLVMSAVAAVVLILWPEEPWRPWALLLPALGG